jgi:hypothetical protein
MDREPIVTSIQLVDVFTSTLFEGEPVKRLWVAAVPREQAVDEVRKQIPDDWRAELAQRWLTTRQAADLSLAPGQVREPVQPN